LRGEGQIVKLSHYLRALCLSIKQQAEEIEVDVQADELELSIDRAVPLGWRPTASSTRLARLAEGSASNWSRALATERVA
jgi:hypothetical protein